MIQPRRVPAKPDGGGDADDSDREHSIWQWIRVYCSSGLSCPESQDIFLAFHLTGLTSQHSIHDYLNLPILTLDTRNIIDL